VRAEPMLPLAQQLFHPSACARQVFRMLLPLPLLWSAVIRALDRLGHPGGLDAHKTRPLAGLVTYIWTPCARHAGRSCPAGPPTSVGQQPGPIPRFASVARRRTWKLHWGGLSTVSLRSFPPNGSVPRQESTLHPPRNFSFSVLKLTDCDNQRGLNRAPSQIARGRIILPY